VVVRMDKRLLFLSDSPLTVTGYATICRNISNKLSKKDWDVHVMGHNYLGQTLMSGVKYEDGSGIDFKLHGTGMAPYCQDILEPKLRELKPDVFMILLDTFMCYPWLLNKDLAPAKSIFYFPSDGGGQLPSNCEQILNKVTVPVAMSKFGKQQVESLYNIPCEYIPHAVDEKMFYPLPKEEKDKLRVKWGLKDKFVVGTVARNQGRKMMDRTIKGFAQFCKDKPDAILLMHTDPQDGAAVSDLQRLIHRYNIENRVIFTGMKYYKGFDYKEMNEVYNLMDVFLLTTSGEGFGIPIIEAMSCGVPVVATNYTTTQELVLDNDAGLGIELAAELTGSWDVERGVCSINDCALALSKMYVDATFRDTCSFKGRDAVLNYYTWDVVMKQWEELLERMTND